jgi:hypothetical protein
MMPGALGRCDPPHVLFYGMGASLLLMLELGCSSRRKFIAFSVAYAAVYIVMMQMVNVAVFFGVPYRDIVFHPIRAVRALSQSVHNYWTPTDLSYLRALDKYPGIGLPLATYGRIDEVESYLFTRRQVLPEFYIGLVGVYTETEMARKLGDVARQEFVLVRDGMQRARKEDPCQAHLRTLRWWFVYPTQIACKRLDLDSYGELTRFLEDHYRQVERVGPCVVLRRSSPTASATSLTRQPADSTDLTGSPHRSHGRTRS